MTLSQNSALLKNSKSKAKVRCWQSNPLSKVNESKIGYTVKSTMKVVGNGVGGKILCENLTVSSKYDSILKSKSKFKVKKVLSAKYIP